MNIQVTPERELVITTDMLAKALHTYETNGNKLLGHFRSVELPTKRGTTLLCNVTLTVDADREIIPLPVFSGRKYRKYTKTGFAVKQQTKQNK